MAGSTYGDSPYGGDLPPWRGIVEAATDAGAAADSASGGHSEAQGASAVEPASDLDVNAVVLGVGTTGAQGESGIEARGVVVVESGADAQPEAVVVSSTAVVVEAGACVVQDGDLSLVSLTVGAAQSNGAAGMAGTGDLAMHASSIAATTFEAEGETDHETVTATNELPTLFDPQPPALAPLVASHAADDLEAELKEVFLDLFESEIRPDERYVNVLGVPHLGIRELVEQSLASDGLSIYRGATNASNAGAYLLRSWRSGNPKRGLHLLKVYLQLMWPNVWSAKQMWQDKARPYPTALSAEDGGNHYLTSRVNVTLPARTTTGGDVSAISAGLRASLPARMVMNLAITSEEEFSMGIANAYYVGLVAQSYEGTFS